MRRKQKDRKKYDAASKLERKESKTRKWNRRKVRFEPPRAIGSTGAGGGTS